MTSPISSAGIAGQNNGSLTSIVPARRKTVVERFQSAFVKVTTRVSRQNKAGTHQSGPLSLTIPPNLPSISKHYRKSQLKLHTQDSHLLPLFIPLGSNYSQWQNEQLPTFRAAAVSQGAGINTPSKEDRIIFIDDLHEHVHTNYPKYDTEKFGDTMPLPPADNFIIPPEVNDTVSTDVSDYPIINNFKLFAVFDGHCGQFASTFLQYRFPLELCGNESFKKGLYEQALTETYHSIHTELLKAQKYAPEGPNNDFSSGATASVILVTPTRTFFAGLGDSPILIWRRNEKSPEMLIKEHDAENKTIHARLVESNVFLVLIREVAAEGDYQREVATHNVYYLVTNKGVKQKVLSQAAAAAAADTESEKGDAGGHKEANAQENSAPESEQPQPPIEEDIPFSDLRMGFSALNVFGTLGDSMYDTEVFNTLIDELVTYREDRQARLEQTIKRLEDQERTGVIVEPIGVVMGPDLEDTLLADSLLSSNATAAAVAAYANPVLAAGAKVYEEKKDDEKKSKKEAKEAEKKKKKTIWKTDNSKNNTLAVPVKEDEISETEVDDSPFHDEDDGKSNEPSETDSLSGSASISATTNTTITRKLSDIPHILFPFEVATSLQELAQIETNDFVYSEFRWWIMSRPKWEYLRKHVSLLKKETHLSRVLLAALRNLNASHRLTCPGLLRTPETKSIANRDLALFVVASDGVIRYYDKFKEEFQGMVMRNSEDPERIVELMKEYMKWLRDDRSVIVCRYGFGTQELYKDPEIPTPADNESSTNLTDKDNFHDESSETRVVVNPQKRGTPFSYASSAFSVITGLTGNSGLKNHKDHPKEPKDVPMYDQKEPNGIAHDQSEPMIVVETETQSTAAEEKVDELPREESETTLHENGTVEGQPQPGVVGRLAKMIKIIR
ncbi:hypothetical protein HK098_000769 [Nowakowskiella sp. JEL0407]|nr:hypothetical protein HK098_000769 [Nowakowskiella sp. JEL0407]